MLVRLAPLLLLCLSGCNGGDPTAAPLPALPPRQEPAGLGPAGEVRAVRHAIVAFTGEVRGEIEACGCPTVPYGGFARRGVLLDQLRAEGLPVFVFDVGEMLVRGQVAADPGDRPERARAVLDLARGAGLDAWAPGPVDLGAGGLRMIAGTNAYSANWRDTAGQPLLPGATVVERDGIRVGVVGLSAPAKELGSTEALAAARAAMAAAGPADTWVALSNLPAAEATRLAEGLEGLGAVLSLRNGSHDAPVATAGAPVIETPDRGRYLTIVRLALGSGAAAWKIVEGGAVDALAQERARVARLPAEAAANPTKLTAAELAVATLAAGHNLALVEDHPLGSDLDLPTPLDPRIAAFKEKSTAAARNRVASAPPVAGYATSNACVRCHSERFAGWSLSEHARAFEALLPRNAEANPECIGCHSTGWGEPGGFADLEPGTLRAWKAVQCEACHGPLAGHPDQGTPARPVTEATCTRCHDAANSPQFDYARYLARTSCVTASVQEADERGTPPR